jgi:murein DD-endopeptidase MepM/ murein hydrolase activator NlpD
VRTIAIVLVTAIAAAALTSAVWLALLHDEHSDRPVVATIRLAPATPRAKPKISKPQPAAVPSNVAPPKENIPQPAITTPIGEIPDDLLAKRLTIPVPGINASDLRPSFFEMRGDHRHEATDIMAARGQPVVAVEDGTIAKLFTSVPGGLTIYQFDPTEKYAYYYAHLDHYADGLAQGSKVTRGQTIGYVGSTGDADAAHPHLHFGIFLLGPEKQWWKGDALDPYPALMASNR